MTLRIHFLEGQTFGRLLVSNYLGADKWRCKCECGKTSSACTDKLVSGKTRSCGCLGVEIRAARSLKHGMAQTLTYMIWATMKARCSNPRNKEFKNYGGRGIKVCDRWIDFAAFFADMGECPPGYSIDRGEVDGNYEPGNCRWIPMADQAATTRAAQRKREATPEILRLRGIGYSQQRIADLTHLDQTTVSRVLSAHGQPTRVMNGRSWRSAA
jgi:hypothetical protein